MPPSAVHCLPAKGAFAREGFVTMWSDCVELWDVGPTLRVMLRTMAEFAMLSLPCWRILACFPIISSPMLFTVVSVSTTNS